MSKVLLVEDDIDVMLIFKRALEKGGYTVGAFSNPYDALEHFKANPSSYDLLLTDVKMHDMSGFELARRLKELNPETRLLFTTAYEVTRNQFEKELAPLLYPDSLAKTQTIKKESAFIIPKPSKLERILASIKEVLSDYSSLSTPSDQEHIVLLYSDKNDHNGQGSNYNDVISQYINGGLSQNQLCIYTYVEKDAETAMEHLSKKITNYEENVRAGNLLLVDFKPFCSSAMDNSLKPFDELMHIVEEKTRDRVDKRVRIVGRAAGWLYENKHFDQCLALEQWWHTKPFKGSLVCPYKMSLLEHKDFFEHQDSMFIRHDTILKI
ncbi:MAG: response regulator [Thermoproteota archaeon]|nr:response regulator [Thermoproteota archaeon]